MRTLTLDRICSFCRGWYLKRFHRRLCCYPVLSIISGLFPSLNHSFSAAISCCFICQHDFSRQQPRGLFCMARPLLWLAMGSHLRCSCGSVSGHICCIHIFSTLHDSFCYLCFKEARLCVFGKLHRCGDANPGRASRPRCGAGAK